MHHSAFPSPPRVGLHVGGHVHDAVAVMLGGQRACLVLDDAAPRPSERARLRLDWDDGRVTELDARVRNVDSHGQVAHMDICRVDGDWRPFLEYLASAAC